ncbi:uncharacterized protein LOC134228687 [Saccostrea cucullata]|uniref:uncharacterized protein LOC134228687 n=1 Tax=Saccostrea cuccullata TaxID=36930 RepID=UPI002ED42BBE
MGTTRVPAISMCAYLCESSSSCKVFHYNNISQECSLYNSQNHRDVGEEVGSNHFQIMPKACVPGKDEWIPDLQKCIYTHATPILYKDAQATCHTMSKELVSLETTQKYLAIKSLMKRFDMKFIHVYAKRVAPLSYTWRDGSLMTGPWCPQQPFEDRECMGLIVDDWCPSMALDDSSCTDDKRLFFCE